MGTWEDIEEDTGELNLYIVELRDKLWREDKIKLQGYTFSEWKKKEEEEI